jgi:hypothetical protein
LTNPLIAFLERDLSAIDEDCLRLGESKAAKDGRFGGLFVVVGVILCPRTSRFKCSGRARESSTECHTNVRFPPIADTCCLEDCRAHKHPEL